MNTRGPRNLSSLPGYTTVSNMPGSGTTVDKYTHPNLTPTTAVSAPILPTITHRPPPPRSKIDGDFVRKFCRICGPICILLSIGMAMYFLNFTFVAIFAESNVSDGNQVPSTKAINISSRYVSIYNVLMIAIIVIGCITLVVFILALLTKCFYLLILYSFYHAISNVSILMGVISQFIIGWYNDDSPWGGGLWITCAVLFIIAYFFFTNYTHWQVLKLWKLMRMGPATTTVSYNPANGAPILYSLPQDGTAIPPPYPGGPSIPFEHPHAYDQPPVYGNWTLSTRLA